MEKFILTIILVFCTFTLTAMEGATDTADIMTERYKRSMDAGADAAAKYRSYKEETYLLNQGTGYGTGYDNSNNVRVNRDEPLKWFYRIFFANMSINGAAKQAEYKKYIQMKAIVSFDRIMIADETDNWVYDREYIIKYRGKDYKFTLSDQVYDISANVWRRDADIGLTTAQRKMLTTEYIRTELSKFLNARKNKESGNSYVLKFSLNDIDEKLSGVNGVNFIVFSEGMPLPSYNADRRKKIYTFGVGGSEIIRGG